jgi:hypothetical protein
MVQLRSYILACVLALACFSTGAALDRKFYPDDPIQAAPKPMSVGKLEKAKINELFDYLNQTRRQKTRPANPSLGSLGVNTMGEVPDSAWFTNRIGRQRLTKEQLKRGAGNENLPQPPFIITGAKTEGITPGFQMRDAKKRLFFIKPDPISNPEISTGADIIGSKFFYAIGYNTPENYIVKLKPSDWTISKDARITGAGGFKREMVAKDLTDIMAKVPLLPDGSFRAVASLAVAGKLIGPFRYEGTRSDDPNDTIPHEWRRELRGLHVFCAWLNHTDAKSANSLDSVVQEGSLSFVRHYLIDFGSAFGSDGDIPKDARFGHEYQIPTAGKVLLKSISLGLWTEDWERARYPKLKAVGRIGSETFNPEKWKPNYPNQAFMNRLPDDEFWAAKIVMCFSDEDIRAIVETGEYSDPRVVDYLVTTLAKRRDKIGQAYFSKVLPLDSFRIANGQLLFDNLAEKSGFRKAQTYRVTWSQFDNTRGATTPIPEDNSFSIPRAFASASEESYVSAGISAQGDDRKSVTVYLRKRNNNMDAVGISRAW